MYDTDAIESLDADAKHYIATSKYGSVGRLFVSHGHCIPPDVSLESNIPLLSLEGPMIMPVQRVLCRRPFRDPRDGSVADVLQAVL